MNIHRVGMARINTAMGRWVDAVNNGGGRSQVFSKGLTCVFASPRLRIPMFPLLHILWLMLLSVASCSTSGQSTDALFAAANSQLASAREFGAEDLAEYKEAQSLLTEAEAALENKDKGVRSLIKKAHAKARLAEALARQLKAEAEATRLEAELEKASIEAEAARQEREAAESELNQDSPD